MSNQNFNNIPNLFVYTKTNIDEKLKHYTLLSHLSANYTTKEDANSLRTDLNENIEVVNANLIENIEAVQNSLDAYKAVLSRHYSFTNEATSLSGWVDSRITNAMSKAFVCKGKVDSFNDLPKTTGTTYIGSEEYPKIGDIWLVNSGILSLDNKPIYDEYICVKIGTGIDNDNLVEWELNGNLTNMELYENFYTKNEGDARFARVVNGVNVQNGSVTISMNDVVGHEDYTLNSDLLAVSSAINATTSQLNDSIITLSTKVKSDFTTKVESDEAISIAITNLKNSIETDYNGKINLINEEIDAINETDLSSLILKEDIISPVSLEEDLTENKIGDVRFVNNGASTDAYIWTGENSKWRLFAPMTGKDLSATFATNAFASKSIQNINGITSYNQNGDWTGAIELKASDLLDYNTLHLNTDANAISTTIIKQIEITSGIVKTNIENVNADLNETIEHLSGTINNEFYNKVYINDTLKPSLRNEWTEDIHNLSNQVNIIDQSIFTISTDLDTLINRVNEDYASISLLNDVSNSITENLENSINENSSNYIITGLLAEDATVINSINYAPYNVYTFSFDYVNTNSKNVGDREFTIPTINANETFKRYQEVTYILELPEFNGVEYEYVTDSGTETTVIKPGFYDINIKFSGSNSKIEINGKSTITIPDGATIYYENGPVEDESTIDFWTLQTSNVSKYSYIILKMAYITGSGNNVKPMIISANIVNEQDKFKF